MIMSIIAFFVEGQAGIQNWTPFCAEHTRGDTWDLISDANEEVYAEWREISFAD